MGADDLAMHDDVTKWKHFVQATQCQQIRLINTTNILKTNWGRSKMADTKHMAFSINISQKYFLKGQIYQKASSGQVTAWW